MIGQGILRLIIQTGGTSGRKGRLRTKKGGGGRDPGSILLLRDSPFKVGPISLEARKFTDVDSLYLSPFIISSVDSANTWWRIHRKSPPYPGKHHLWKPEHGGGRRAQEDWVWPQACPLGLRFSFLNLIRIIPPNGHLWTWSLLWAKARSTCLTAYLPPLPCLSSPHTSKTKQTPPKKTPLTFSNIPALSQCSKCHQYNLRNRNFSVTLKTSLSFIFPHPTYHRGHPPPPSKCLRLIHFCPLAPSVLTWTLATILDLNPIFFLRTLQQVPAWQQGHCLENAILLLKNHQRQAALFQ